MGYISAFFSGDLSLWAYIIPFAVSALAIWFIGSFTATVVDCIADRTGMGQAFAGLLLLAVATSLPEFVISFTAMTGGNPVMAPSNLLGGVVFQTGILILADFLIRDKPLTVASASPEVLFQGIALMTLLGLVFTFWLTRDYLDLGFVSAGSVLLAVMFLLLLNMSRNFGKTSPWQIGPGSNSDGSGKKKDSAGADENFEGVSTARLFLRFALAAIGILIAGVIITKSADGIVKNTGLSAGFVGATLVAISSSLPEVSTTWRAVRMRAYSMAISNIFGSNGFCVALLAWADAVHPQSEIFHYIDQAALFSAGVGVVVTGIYILGLLERRDRSYARLGIDSWVVLLIVIPSFFVQWLLSKG